MNKQRDESTAPSDPGHTNRDPSDVAPLPPVESRRRRFLGAGVATAPALLTLASQPALGVTCFTPSRSLSRNTSISQQGKNGNCLNAESPGNYKEQQTPGHGAYHWPASIPPSTAFHSRFPGQRFMTGTGVNVRSMTMGEVLNLVGAPDQQQVAFHLVGAYLNVNGGNGAIIPPHILTSAGVVAIYDEWDRNGFYEPMAGVRWYATEIKNYLISNGIVK